jgi:hypothetical protein
LLIAVRRSTNAAEPVIQSLCRQSATDVAVRQSNLKGTANWAPMVTACRGGGEAAGRRRGGLRK